MENKFVLLLLIFLFAFGLYYAFGTLLNSVVENDVNGQSENRTTINEAQRVTTQANINALLRTLETEFVLGNIEAGQIEIINNEISKGNDIRAILPDAGIIMIRNDGRIALAIIDKGFCVTKGFVDTTITIDVDDSDCSHPDVK